MPVRENIAPMRVVIRNSQELLGCSSVTWRVVGLVATAVSTTSIPALSEVVQSVLTRLMLNAASSAVNGASLLNLAPSCSLNVYVRRSSLTVQLLASSGTISPFASSLTRPS